MSSMAAHRIHHLNCGTMCPLGSAFLGGDGHFWERGLFVCHCILVETDEGLVLIESGLGTDDLKSPSRLPPHFQLMTRPPEDGPTALEHVKRLGFEASDVRHILLTHLDLDHAGGISDFPDAKVHVFKSEHSVALAPKRADKARYIPAQFAHKVDWELYDDTEGERWHGFERVTPLTGLGDDLALVPLIGHSVGHCAIALRSEKGWLLHCGDGFFHRGDLLDPPSVPWGVRLFQRVVDDERWLRVRNMGRLRRLHKEDGQEVKIICSHDPQQLRELQA
jgi:glyoxylase-like metal-dependent hydrolase (beta-lactamase superfamily II)